MSSLAALWILVALAGQPASPDAGNPLAQGYMPLRAPDLVRACARAEDDNLGYRLVGFCAGYVTAVLENDARLDGCYPFRAEVMDAIVARQRTAPQTDNEVLARDFVVAIARDLCRRTRPS
jgi:hypothetical protein